MKRFLDVMYDDTKNARKIKSCDYNHEGKYPIIDQSSKNVIGYTDEIDGLYKDVPVIIFGDHTRRFKLVEEPFFIGADGTKVLKLHSSVYDYKFIYYYLLHKKIPDTGYNRHFKWVKELEFPEIPRSIQSDIVKKFEVLNDLIFSKNKLLELFDILIKSRFVEMFGDPNMVALDKSVKFSSVAKIITGNTPSRKSPEYYGDYIEWIKSDNIISTNLYISQAKEFLSEQGAAKGRVAPKDSLLMTCIAGSIRSIGNVGICDRSVAFNQQINAIVLKNNINPLYIYWLLKLFKPSIIANVEMSLKGIISKSQLENMLIPIIASQEEQELFIKFALQINKLKSDVQKSIDETQLLMDSLMQEYFG